MERVRIVRNRSAGQIRIDQRRLDVELGGQRTRNRPDPAETGYARAVEIRLGDTVIASTEWGDIEEARLALYSKTLEKIRSTDSLALDLPPR